jgi:hypothetical protein
MVLKRQNAEKGVDVTGTTVLNIKEAVAAHRRYDRQF